jgi:hypothetical protein
MSRSRHEKKLAFRNKTEMALKMSTESISTFAPRNAQKKFSRRIASFVFYFDIAWLSNVFYVSLMNRYDRQHACTAATKNVYTVQYSMCPSFD